MIGLHLSRRFTVKHVHAYGVLFYLHHILKLILQILRSLAARSLSSLSFSIYFLFCFLGKDEQSQTDRSLTQGLEHGMAHSELRFTDDGMRIGVYYLFFIILLFLSWSWIPNALFRQYETPIMRNGVGHRAHQPATA